MKLNTTSDIPLFEQLKNDLLEQIKKGIYISGQQSRQKLNCLNYIM